MALDEADRKTIGEMITAGVTKLTEQVGALAGAMKTHTDGFAKAVDDAIDKKIKPLADTVAKIGEGGKPEPKPGDKPDAAEALKKSIAEAVAEATKPLAEFVSAKKSEESKAAERAAAKVLVAKTLAEKKLGGLLKNEQVLERLVNAAPKDADAVMAAVEAERKFAASLGIKPESFGADVAGEGGRTPDGGKPSVEEMKKRTSEAIGAAAKARAAIV